MHRRSVWTTLIRLSAVVALVFVVLTGRATGQEGTPEASPSAPPAATPSPSYVYEVDGLGTGLVQTYSPGMGWMNTWEQNVALTRVTIEPGNAVEQTVSHFGSSVLFVERGIICYQVLEFNGASLVLFTPPDLKDNPQPVATPDLSAASGCAMPPATCLGEVFCDLTDAAISSVVVEAGQSIQQSIEPDKAVKRGYANISTETAVIWIAQLQTDTGEAAPCGGGCP
jgi:hypothetical protein